MKLQRLAIPFFLLLLVSASALFAQGTTGALIGTITQSGVPLPGVTVTITSPSLQGTRTSVTNENGSYSFPSIPPGQYTAAFSLSGLQDVKRNVSVNLVESARLDADMKVSAVSEAITVTADQSQVLETTQVQTNFKQATINRLPVNRNPTAQAALAPGITNGVNGLQISGAMTYDNLYLVNGAVVNENLRGQPHNLFIEDAIQETTVLSGGISAEFGRFTGGVVSSITKSGGNEFSGSVRDSLDNPKWTDKSFSAQPDPVSTLNNTYEGTLGGRIIRDRLWFFGAGRLATTAAGRTISAISTLPNPAIAGYTVDTKNNRFDLNMTGNITNKHSILASYQTNNVEATNNCQIGCLDTRTINPNVSNPNNFKTAHYSGVITNNFLIEGDYAKKYFAFVGFGGSQPRGATSAVDLASGTPGIDQLVTGATFNAPYFCGSCGAELRNNNEWEAKGHYFLGTKGLGTHSVVFGYDDWAEQRQSNNYQSPTDFRYDVRFNTPVQNPDGTVSIAIHGDPAGNADRFLYFPVAFASLGSNLVTKSVFVNDKWDFTDHFSFNLGARYDQNAAKDSAGNPVSNDKAVSPRLGAIYDVFGNGRLRLDANYGKYVGRLAETVAGSGSSAGNPATLRFAYAGPDLPLMDSRLAIQHAFEWFLANGGLNRAVISQSIPGVNTRLEGQLQSPSMREITVGAGTQIGSKGFVRVDYINRDWSNFYAQFDTLAIGTVISNGARTDLNLIGNSAVPTRKYQGVQFQAQYQLPKGFGMGGNYTYSKLRGNVDGETTGGGPVTFAASTVSYPEYQGFAQNAPIGYLQGDQRHKVRVWGSFDLPTPIGHFNFGAIERFDSGTPFSAAQLVPITAAMLVDANGKTIFPNGAARNTAADYANRPTSVNYFFSDRGQFRWDNVLATDLALNYELPVRGLGLFAKGEVRNAFDRKAVLNGNTLVNTAATNSNFTAFNPFTQTPLECPRGAALATCKTMGANYQLGSAFGTVINTATTFSQNGNFQLPRTYLFSAGVRF
jgi:outer membrane receptor protein involved in Fe transport